MTVYLTVEEVIQFHSAEVGPNLLVDRGGLESAVARPQQSAFGEDAYPDFSSKAAALFDGVVNAHAFLDGNKRAGLGALVLFCLLNGRQLAIDEVQGYELTMHVAGFAGGSDVKLLAEMLERYIQPLPLDKVPLDG